MAWLLEQACTNAGVQPIIMNAPRDVEVTSRSDGKQTWLFVLNHSNDEVQVQLPADGTDLISGSAVESLLQLGPQGVAIVQLGKIKKKKNSQ